MQGSMQRIVICDYNDILHAVTGLLRMSGYSVFQAYDAAAAAELCFVLPDLKAFILNSEGAGTDTLVARIRAVRPELPILHIGAPLPGHPDVPHVAEPFTAAQLLRHVSTLVG